MEFIEDQKEINSYFEIAKSKNLNFANNIHDYMFMYKKQNEYLITYEEFRKENK